MQSILFKRRCNQYETNISKKVIKKRPKFNIGDTVCYYYRRGKFAKESSLSGTWSRTIYRIHKVRQAHKFNPMHTYELAELVKTTLIEGLPPIQENLLKTAKTTTTDEEPTILYAVEKILKRCGKKVLVKWLG